MSKLSFISFCVEYYAEHISKTGAVVLSELSLLNGSAMTAILCRKCKKVIIDYDVQSCE